MPALIRLAAAAAAVVAVGLVGQTFLPRPAAGPGAAPSASASPAALWPSPFTERFDSALHGVTIGYPSGWQVRPATQSWRHNALSFDAPDVDVIFDPAHGDDLYLAVSSEPLKGQAADDWCCGSVIAATQICSEGAGAAFGSYSVDGAKGRIEACGGLADQGHVVVVATPTRGYAIALRIGDERLGQTYDSDWFQALLQTVDLHEVAP